MVIISVKFVDTISGRFQQKSSFHSSGTNAPPCVAKKGSVQEIHESIRFTQRSKSFKRSIPGYLFDRQCF